MEKKKPSVGEMAQAIVTLAQDLPPYAAGIEQQEDLDSVLEAYALLTDLHAAVNTLDEYLEQTYILSGNLEEEGV